MAGRCSNQSTGIWPRRRWWLLLGLVAAVAAACSNPNPPPDLAITVSNDTNHDIYALSPVADGDGYVALEENIVAQLAPVFIAAGETRTLRVGETNAGIGGPGGCVNAEWWFVYARSGERYWNTLDPTAEQAANDFVVLDHWDGSNCWPSDEGEYTLRPG